MEDRYQISRQKIRERLYTINTTAPDRDAAYELTVSYVLEVAENCWRAAARSYGWEMDNIEDSIKADLLQQGIRPQKTEPGTDAGK